MANLTTLLAKLNVTDEVTRGRLYAVALALLSVLVAYDIISGSEQQVWAEVLKAVLGVGSAALATRNTTRRRDTGTE